MTRRYAREEVKKEFDDWVVGETTRDDMTLKEWHAFKRRINRAGHKKTPAMFAASRKNTTQQEWAAKRKVYLRAYRRRRKIQKASQALANAESDVETAFYPIRGESAADQLQRSTEAQRLGDEAKITYAQLVEQQ